MIDAVINNPQANAMALRAFGMSQNDVRTLRDMQIPIWSVVLVSAVVGGLVVARYAPRVWIDGLRTIGK
jgi:hypothetical protein